LVLTSSRQRSVAGADDLAAAGALALEQGGEHAVDAVHAGEQVTDRDADALGIVAVGAGQGHDPGLALGDLVVAGAAALAAVVRLEVERERLLLLRLQETRVSQLCGGCGAGQGVVVQ